MAQVPQKPPGLTEEEWQRHLSEVQQMQAGIKPKPKPKPKPGQVQPPPPKPPSHGASKPGPKPFSPYPKPMQPKPGLPPDTPPKPGLPINQIGEQVDPFGAGETKPSNIILPGAAKPEPKPKPKPGYIAPNTVKPPTKKSLAPSAPGNQIRKKYLPHGKQ